MLSGVYKADAAAARAKAPRGVLPEDWRSVLCDVILYIIFSLTLFFIFPRDYKYFSMAVFFSHFLQGSLPEGLKYGLCIVAACGHV